MRLIARFEKTEAVCPLSHLDVQRAFQRALRRSGAPLSYSVGFNPHPLLSFASALAVGITSEGEWLDAQLSQAVEPAAFINALNSALPGGFRVLEAHEVDEHFPALTPHTAFAVYRIRLETEAGVAEAQARLAEMTKAPIWVEKHGKGGVKTVDLQPLIRAWECVDSGNGAEIALTCVHTPQRSLNPRLLMKAMPDGFCTRYAIHRVSLLNAEQKPLFCK